MKKVAVFICAISMENQQKIIQGILKEAKRKEIVCYVFTCHINFRSKKESQEGSYNIMRLPDLSRFDGAIIMKNTIQYSKIADELERRIKKSNVPCVSIDQKIDGMGNVMVENYNAQFHVVKYLIKECKARKINFVAGYAGNYDGEERKKAYIDALNAYDISFEAERIYNGNYSINSGMEAVEYWVSKDKKLPDAIVCANDQMAIGVITKLKEFGYKVPDDVFVTGFDGESICDAFEPRIATVDKHQDVCGGYAIDLLAEQWDGKEPRTIMVEASFNPSESCGFRDDNGKYIENIRSKYVSDSIILRQVGDSVRNMAADLANVESLEAFYDSLKSYIHIDDMKSCYLCMCDINQVFYRENVEKKNLLDFDNLNTKYTKKATIPIAYYKDGFTSFPDFLSGNILPDEAVDGENADFYVVSPINYHNYCFGYFVTADNYFALESDFYHSWIANIAIALENIRKLIIMRGLMHRLNEMWVFDTMTGLYNRAGFYNFAEDMLREMKDNNSNSFMLFIDLDGLKRINDTLGHEMGDSYICSMGEILKKEKSINDLVMRYGGDEFVIFGSTDDESEVKKLIGRIESDMKEYSFGDNAYPLEASIGMSFFKACEIDDIKRFIHDADEKMYELKKEKKKGGAANGRV